MAFLESIERPRPRTLAQLLRRVLARCCEMTGAGAGVVWVPARGTGQRMLAPVEARRGTAGRQPPEGLLLPVDSGSIAGHVALTGETVRERDVRRIPPDRAWRLNPDEDRATGCESRSMLCFPLVGHEGEITAVVQLVNRRAPGGGRILAFPKRTVAALPLIDRVVGGEMARMAMLERIRAQNRTLRERSRRLRQQREQIAALNERTEEAFRLSVGLLARAAELYDDTTASHILRVNEYSRRLAMDLGMPADFCEEIGWSAQLHDVGKMIVDTAVLKKSGPLSARDRKEMDRHPIYGYEILRSSGRLRMAAEIALNHHEKWDGGGYPRGIAGKAIPVAARIVQVADVYDALRAARHYKRALGHDEAVRIILEGDDRIEAAGHFDPWILETFGRHHRRFDGIWKRFAD